MKKRLLIATMILALASLTACGRAAEEKAEEPKEEVVVEEPEEEVVEEAEPEEEEKADVPAGSDNWTDMEFTFDGISMKLLETPYKTLEENGWTFNMADYGYEDGYIMNPKDKVTSTIDIENPKYMEDPYAVRASAGFINNGDAAVDITESNVWAISFNVLRAIEKAEPYPEVKLAGGITWGATYEDLKVAYGEATEEPYRSEDLGYYTYEYKDDQSRNMRFVVYDEAGLVEIDLHNYN
ncbi:hypothetical protein LJC18_03755 [Lachnospiraceae bacterium OttesenSCG-928-E19]|nr:hypothetical protein [Lachnospiraceae bacterium OttesenSCG-928-E19]